jgi:hypothetical protein
MIRFVLWHLVLWLIGGILAALVYWVWHPPTPPHDR